MKFLIPLFLLFSSSLFAQYSNISLLDQLRLEMEEQDNSGTFLMAGNTADVSQLTEMDKIDFLQKAIVSLVAERYISYAGDPYLNKEFGPAVLRDLSMSPYPLAAVNYNAYSGRIEYQSKDNWIEFRPDYFPRLDILAGSRIAKTLVYGLLPEFPNHYSTLLFKGNRVQAAVHSKVFTFENKTYDASPVKTRFAPKELLYLYLNGKWMASSFKSKALAKDLGAEKAIMKFIKEKKLNPAKAEDLRQILTYADRL